MNMNQRRNGKTNPIKIFLTSLKLFGVEFSKSFLRVTSYIFRFTALFLFLISLQKNSTAQTQIGGVINTYWQVISVDFCNNRVALPVIAVGINIGDKVLLMQMQGALIDSSDSPTYGTVVNDNG